MKTKLLSSLIAIIFFFNLINLQAGNQIENQKFTGQIDTSREQNYMDSEECLNYPTHYFITNEGENLLVVFLNKIPEGGNITIEGFFQEVSNSCTKGGSNQLFMVSKSTITSKNESHQFNIKVTETGSGLTQKQAQDALDVHNEARAEVGVAPLSWSVELSQTAQEWADHLAKNGCEMKHSETSDTGENLYWTSRGSDTSVVDAVLAWYSEKKDFKNIPIKVNNLHKIGHYSQIVWKNTTHVGMASSECSKGQTIVVANYSPPGNYLGERAY